MSVAAVPGARLARRHVLELDGIRGVAIALVMALHFVNNQVAPTNVLERAAVTLTNYGLWGVDLFFVLSGFLITGILVDAKGAPGYFANFFARRALRIFPLYFGVLLLLTVIVPRQALAALDPELLQLRDLWPWLWFYLTNVYLGPQTTFSIPYVSHFWSLAVEEHFYLVWPFLICYASTRTAMRACLVLGTVALALRIGFSAIAPTQLYAGVLTPCRIDALCAGAWFALAAREASPLAPRRALRIAWLAGAAVVMLSAWHVALRSGEAAVLPLRTTALAVFFGALIHGATYHAGLGWFKAALRQPWLQQLGRYSYGLYVFHGIIAYGMHRYGVPQYLGTLTPIHTLNSVLLVTFGVGLSYAAALVSYHGFELPFLSLKPRFDSASSPASAATLSAHAILPTMPEAQPIAVIAQVAPRPQSASIVINNFNYGTFVGHAIDSALAQTHPAQVVVVDDGSTDDSKSVIESYGSQVQAMFTVNGGQAAAMNTGFVAATGDIVLFLDADDLLEPTVVETLVAVWQPDTVLAQYPLHIIDVNEHRVGIYPDPPSSLSQGDVREELLRTGSFGANVTSGLAFHRRALAQVMPLPSEQLRNAADGYLVRAVAFLGQVQRLDVVLGSYRRHERNDSNVCAADGGLANGFRKKIGYTRQELDATRAFAAKHGQQVRPDLGEQNADYIGYRLFLLLIDPASERLVGARRRELLPRYLAARWASSWPLKRRLPAMVVAFAASVSSAPVAEKLLTWLHDPEARPGWWRGVARRLRRT